MSNITLDKFIEKIRQTFDTVVRPDDAEIFIHSANHIFDTAEAVAKLNAIHWKNIELEILKQNRDRISYFTSKAFLFFYTSVSNCNHYKP